MFHSLVIILYQYKRGDEELPEDVETDRAGAFDVSRLEEVTPRDGYVTLELKVISIEYRGEGEVRTGTLKDDTDMVDFVDFDGCDDFDKLEKGDTHGSKACISRNPTGTGYSSNPILTS